MRHTWILLVVYEIRSEKFSLVWDNNTNLFEGANLELDNGIT